MFGSDAWEGDRAVRKQDAVSLVEVAFLADCCGGVIPTAIRCTVDVEVDGPAAALSAALSLELRRGMMRSR